jgi:hypothetical protein
VGVSLIVIVIVDVLVDVLVDGLAVLHSEHRRWQHRSVRRVTLLVFTACVGNVGGDITDSGGNPPDAAVPDAGTHEDAGVPDSGTPDAGPHDAGVPDAGVADAGTPDAGPVGCTAAFCDDFESYDGGVPKGPWSLSLNGGAAVMDTSKAHSGARSVHISTDGMSSYRQAYIGMGAPFFPQTEYYGRVWFWLKATPKQTTHWTNISGEGDVLDAGANVRAYVRFGGQYSPTIMANYDTSGGPHTDCWDHSTSAMPAQQWACFEWHYKQANNQMELWVDGGSVLTVTQTGQGCLGQDLNNQWLLPVFDTLRLGWEHYQMSDPIDLWLDDVALDTQRVGCP